MKEIIYRCNLCNDRCKEDILQGIHRASMEGIVFKHVEKCTIHICMRCIEQIRQADLIKED